MIEQTVEGRAVMRAAPSGYVLWLVICALMFLPWVFILSQRREPWRVRADYDFGMQWMANRLKRYA